MGSAASSLQGQSPVGGVVLAGELPSDATQRHVARRHTYTVQVVSYALGAAALLVYVRAGTIPLLIPSAFFLSGVTLIGVSAFLSEMRVNDRFDDHYLTVFQVAGHVAIQLGFLLVAPEIGCAFLNVLFLIFGVAALRMTPLQVTIAWTLTALAIASIFVLTQVPI